MSKLLSTGAVNYISQEGGVAQAFNNGIIELSANASSTANVSTNGGKLVYDVLLTDTVTNNVTRVLEGQIIVSPSVTR